jgi:hypothetical protein
MLDCVSANKLETVFTSAVLPAFITAGLVPKIVEFGFGNYKGCVDIKITREVKLFVQKALEEKDD